MADNSGSIKDVRSEGDAVVVALGGEIDLHQAPTVHETLITACAGKPKCLVINLEAVSYMDSSGIGTLVEVFRRVKAYDGRLALCRINSRVRSLFEITKLDKFFAIYDTEAEALAG